MKNANNNGWYEHYGANPCPCVYDSMKATTVVFPSGSGNNKAAGCRARAAMII